MLVESRYGPHILVSEQGLYHQSEKSGYTWWGIANSVCLIMYFTLDQHLHFILHNLLSIKTSMVSLSSYFLVVRVLVPLEYWEIKWFFPFSKMVYHYGKYLPNCFLSTDTLGCTYATRPFCCRSGLDLMYIWRWFFKGRGCLNWGRSRGKSRTSIFPVAYLDVIFIMCRII